MGDAKLFITPMTAIFNKPYGKSDDEISLTIQEYNKTLSKYSNEVLIEAWERIKRTHEKQGWPLLAEIIKVCESVPTQSTEKPVEYILTEHDILTHEEGQHALSEGHGNNYLISCMRLNKHLPAEPIIRQNSNKDKSGFTGESLERIKKHDAEMNKKEARLKTKYLTREE